jgi:hypothetical protein
MEFCKCWIFLDKYCNYKIRCLYKAYYNIGASESINGLVNGEDAYFMVMGSIYIIIFISLIRWCVQKKAYNIKYSTPRHTSYWTSHYLRWKNFSFDSKCYL